MKAIAVSELSAQQLTELADLYRTTRDVRVSTRAQLVLLAAEQQLTAPAIAVIVRESEETVAQALSGRRPGGPA